MTAPLHRRSGVTVDADAAGPVPVPAAGADHLAAPSAAAARARLEARWLDLTRRILPTLAVGRGWPVRFDHCFQRILLDAACGGCWYGRIAGRPAYRHAEDGLLAAAVAVGEACVAGTADLPALDRRSRAWRVAARAR